MAGFSQLNRRLPCQFASSPNIAMDLTLAKVVFFVADANNGSTFQWSATVQAIDLD